MNDNISIIYLGDKNTYTRSYKRLMALSELGYNVLSKSHTPVDSAGKIVPPSLLVRVFYKLRLHLDVVGANQWLLSQCKKNISIKLVIIDKGTNVYPWTLHLIKKIQNKITLVFLSEDDMMASHSISYWFRYGLIYYDHVFTTKKFNLPELTSIGARNVHLFPDSFCKKVHYSCGLSGEEILQYGADVSAIGAFEEDRYNTLLYVANNGVNVKVWGGGWSHCVGKHKSLHVMGRYLYDNEYRTAIIATKININFLRKVNRDQITSRSIEIPACGGFMLAERTNRHMDLFIENKEAAYFESDNELLNKINYYLLHDATRKEIASNGRTKVNGSRLSMSEILQDIVSKSLQESI